MLSKHNRMSEVLSRRMTPKKLWLPEAELAEGNEEDDIYLALLCISFPILGVIEKPYYQEGLNKRKLKLL